MSRAFPRSPKTMDFDSLLSRYLEGALSDQELERFQALVDRSPEYRTRLQQILDLRSALHDDALTLFPPAMLAERVRLRVAAAFAAAFAERNGAESEVRRRHWPTPLRLVVGSCMALCLAVGIALGPTVPLVPLAAVDLSSADASASEPLASPLLISTVARNGSEPGSLRAARPTMATVSTPPIVDRTDGEATADATHPVDMHASPPHGTGDLPAHRSLREDVAALFADVGGLASDGGMTDLLATPQRSTGDPLIAAIATDARDRMADQRRRYRRLAFGVLMGSGQVVELKSPTVLLQNSYYFAFGVNPHDRVGLEIGGSTFERRENVIVSNAGSGFAKPSQGSPESSDRRNDGASSPRQRGSTSLITRRYEQQISYGGIFYDRRLRVDASWDICGRVTVGGADNAIVGGIRAYAAYTPSSNRNITLTLGVGGSGLFNLTERDNNTGGNYGVHYGIETGF